MSWIHNDADGARRWADFVQLLRESVITQALVTIFALGVTLYLVAAGRAVPSELWAIDGLVVGFYFGGKAQAQAMRLFQSARRSERTDERTQGG